MSHIPPHHGGDTFFFCPPHSQIRPPHFPHPEFVSPPLGSMSPPDLRDVGGTRNYVPPTMGGMLQIMDQIPHGEWGGQAKNTWCPPHHAGDGFNFGVPPTLGGTESQISARSGGGSRKMSPPPWGGCPPQTSPPRFRNQGSMPGTEESVSPPPWGGWDTMPYVIFSDF